MLVLSIPPRCFEGLPLVTTKKARSGMLAEGSCGEVSPHLFLDAAPVFVFSKGKTQVVMQLPLMPQPAAMFCNLRGRDHQQSQTDSRLFTEQFLQAWPCAAAVEALLRLHSKLAHGFASWQNSLFQELSPGQPPVTCSASSESILLE